MRGFLIAQSDGAALCSHSLFIDSRNPRQRKHLPTTRWKRSASAQAFSRPSSANYAINEANRKLCVRRLLSAIKPIIFPSVAKQSFVKLMSITSQTTRLRMAKDYCALCQPPSLLSARHNLRACGRTYERFVFFCNVSFYVRRELSSVHSLIWIPDLCFIFICCFIASFAFVKYVKYARAPLAT